MIRALTEEPHYLTKFTNGTGAGFTDVSAAHGGTGTGFQPTELLEAALAACVTITLRMYAEKHNIPLEDVSTEVQLDSSSPEEAVFRYDIQLQGEQLTREQREKLLLVGKACSVRRTLSKPIRFESARKEMQTAEVSAAQAAAR